MEERVYQGYVYRRSGPGEPWQMAGPAQPQQSQPDGVVFTNPFRPREEARRDSAEERAERAEARADAAERRSAATLPYDVQSAQANATAAGVRAREAVREEANAPSPQTARIRSQLQTDNVLNAINIARQQIGNGWSTGNTFGRDFFQDLPGIGQNSANLNATLSGIQGSVINDTIAALKAASPTGASGYGSLTETEAARLAASVAALQQTQDAESLTRNLATVERHYRNALALLNGEDPRAPDVAERYGLIPEAPTDMPRASTGGTLTSEGSNEPDPALAGVNSAVADMIRRGRSANDVREYLNRVQPGLGDETQNLDAWVSFIRQNPDRTPQVNVEDRWVPSSGFSRGMGYAGTTPGGAAVIGAADMLSFGALDNLSSNPDVARAVMGGVQQEHPWWYFGGQLAGGALMGGGAEYALGRAGLSGVARLRAGDAAVGAGYSAGSADEPGEDRLAQALLGGGTGVAGGMMGRSGARVAGRAATGIQGAAQRALHDSGVDMTIGQLLGGAAKRTEDRLAGLPFVGDAIRARRTEGLEAFNRAAFNEALDPIAGTTGEAIAEQGVDIARQLRSDAYSLLDPVRVTADAPFVGDMNAAIAAGRALPDPMRTNMEYTLPTRVGEAFDQAGNLSGRDYQQALRGLRRDANSVANDPYGYDFGQVSRQAEDALAALLDRQAPGATNTLRTANEVNRRVETLRDAVNRARNGNRSGATGVFAPSQLSDAAASSARRYGGTQGTTQQPFFDLTRAGQEVLPSSVPDSGTAGRLLLPLLAGSMVSGGSYAAQGAEAENRGGSSATYGAIAAALAAAPYSRTARNSIEELLMAPRPAPLVRLGEHIYENDALAGLLAAPAATIALNAR